MTRAIETPTCLYRSVELRAEPSSDGKTITFSASSETASVKRYFYDRGEYLPEVLLHRKGTVNTADAHALLFNHDAMRIVGPLAKLEIDSSRKLRVTAGFDDTEEGALARTRVSSGSLKGASIGYEVEDGAFRYVAQGETFEGIQGPAMVAQRWTLREVSLTPVAADTAVGIGRSKNPTVPMPARKDSRMDPETNTPTGAPPATPPTPQRVTAPNDGERQRCDMIRTLCNFAGLDASKTLEFISSTKTAEDVRKEIEALRKTDTETPEPALQRSSAGPAAITRDGNETFSRGVTLALMAKGGIKLTSKEDVQIADGFRYLDLQDVARECLIRSGARNIPRGGKDALFGAALERRSGERLRYQGNFNLRSGAPIGHTASDLSTILGNVANLSLFTGWNEAPVTYARFCTIASVADFKTNTIAKLSNIPDLVEQESDSDEVPELFLSDDGESYALATYTGRLGISRKALINDSLSAFTKLPFKAGAAARRKINGLVYFILNNGQTVASVAMSDAAELFKASRGNYATTSSALAIGTLDAGVAAMQNQQGSNGEVLNIPAKFLIVPPDLRMTATQLVNSSAVPLASYSSGVVNPYAGALDVIVDAQMRRGTGGTATAWCLAADPSIYETIEVGLLNGVDAPLFEEFEDASFLGRQYRITIDAAAKAADPLGLYKASGAGG